MADHREIVFDIREEPEGGFSAEALGEPIFTQGETWDELRVNIQDATKLHFDGDELPATVRLVLRREETLAVA